MTPDRWQRVQEVLAEATEMEPASRSAFLDEACRGDPELRKEVESLLSSLEAASEGFLESPAIEAAPELSPATPRAASPSLARGTRLGPYEILAILGAGGMGEVYRAKDTRLGRDVAIKVLPEDVASDARTLARFETEAKAVAALSHPNILALHDVGKEGSVSYAVTELLEGETLRERIREGPLSPRRAIEYGLAIAAGLAAAHEKGIVHRDLKPENVFITRDGHLKILDFGLARQMAIPSSVETNSPTEVKATSAGTIVGTVGYLSPEQVRGLPTDARSDIFALGVVLYEMLSGKRPFQKETAPETMAAILREDPLDLSAVNQSIPPALERIVRHCLEKNPEQRFHSARDLGFALESVSSGSGASVAAAPTSRRRIPILPILLALAIAAVPVAAFLGRRSARYKPPTFQQLTFRRGNILNARYTPDGGNIIYSAAWDGQPMEIFTARLDGTESHPFGVKNADVLAVSSKGEVAFLLKKTNLRVSIGLGTLAVMPLSGGAPRELLENVRWADWSPDGTQLAVARPAEGEWRLEYPIGKTLYRTKDSIYMLRVSSDGKHIAFVEDGPDERRLRFVDTAGKTTTLVAGSHESVGGFTWHDDDKEIVYSPLAGGEIDAVDLNGNVRALYRATGDRWVDDSRPDGRFLIAQSDYALDLIFGPVKDTAEKNLGGLTFSGLADLSQNGESILFNDGESQAPESSNFYLRRTDGSPPIRLGKGFASSLSPDGRYVVASLTKSKNEFSVVPTGPGEPRTVSIGDLALTWASFLRDERSFVFEATGGDEQARIYVIDAKDPTPRAISPPGTTASFLVSPDQKSLAVVDQQKGLVLYSTEGGPARAISGFDLQQGLLQWSAEGRFLYIATPGEIPVRVERFDLTTGRKEPWKTLMPSDPAGVFWIQPPILTPDGRFWAYNVSRIINAALWQVTGL